MIVAFCSGIAELWPDDAVSTRTNIGGGVCEGEAYGAECLGDLGVMQRRVVRSQAGDLGETPVDGVAGGVVVYPVIGHGEGED